MEFLEFELKSEDGSMNKDHGHTWTNVVDVCNFFKLLFIYYEPGFSNINNFINSNFIFCLWILVETWLSLKISYSIDETAILSGLRVS